jgi:hypothetical protein
VVNGNNEFEHASNVHNSLQEVWPPQPDLAGMSAWESGLGKLISGTTIGAFAKRAKTASGYTYKDVRFRCTDASTDGVTLDIKSTRANVFEWSVFSASWILPSTLARLCHAVRTIFE